LKSLWSGQEAAKTGRDALSLRVYTSRLLGRDASLVMHGGGNTSVKTCVRDFFGVERDVLLIKGSGWDLATIEAGGFAAVKMEALLGMAAMKELSDADMVRQQRAAMLDPNAPNPSVEAILHAIIPYSYVDHSHADAVVTITNTPDGRKRIESLYGRRVLIVPYVMPGFVLARKVYQMTRGMNWSQYDGMVLLNHGLFTFAGSAKESYENHIKLVTRAENYIRRVTAKRGTSVSVSAGGALASEDLFQLVRLRRAVSRVQGAAVVAIFKGDVQSLAFSRLPGIKTVTTRGTLTPDHVIRTKPVPVIINRGEPDIQEYARAYKNYFDRHNNGKLKCLDLAPRWAVWPGRGVITFGRQMNEAQIVSDIADHTMKAVQRAQGMGGWKAVTQKDLFAVEYWELEQAKLAKGPKPLSLQGKIALVTGAASGIGKACVRRLLDQGAHVAGLDIQDSIKSLAVNSGNFLGIRCDVTRAKDIKSAVESVVRRFGGLDIVVSNAGNFPPSMDMESMDPAVWEKSLELNLNSHQRLVKEVIPYLSLGLDPTIVIVASKNVPAPGPGAGAYSVAKAGLTQLGRVAALELGGRGIRVNMVHPNQVFDTAIWTRDVLAKRARHYGLTIEQYKTSNILHTEITSMDVADLICAMAGPAFAKTTGAQVPIDGGNERVI
jgi:rhamnose utilization protein RhaD (predicted bifunctional aldolase and dehydrogenase)/NAD(P)-dependent dehydrogenase (short-subunit alcohol dehydrogenase family)